MKSDDFFRGKLLSFFERNFDTKKSCPFSQEISIQKKAAVLDKEEERNAERSWTPPLVCSISRAHFNVTDESIVVVIF